MIAPKDEPRARSHLRVGFYGILGSGNQGNDASLDVTMTFLRREHPDAEFGFLAMGPDRLTTLYGGPAVPLQWYEAHMETLSWMPSAVLKVIGRLLDPFRTLRWVRGYDVVIVPGMGVLESTVPTRPWGAPYGLFWLSLAARIVGARVALVSVGAESGSSRATRWLFGAAARMAHYRSYRDELSRDEMRKMGVDVSEDEVFPDLVFGMDVPEARTPVPGRVGLGLMNYRGNAEDRDRAQALHDSYVEAITRFVRWLLDQGCGVRLFTGDKEDAEVLDGVLARVGGYCDRDGPRVLVTRATTLSELMDVMTDVEVVVATRYHNVLGALKLGIPTVSIGYARKNDVLMAGMGMEAYCQSARSIDVERLIQQYRTLSDHREHFARTLRQHDRANIDGVARQLDTLSSLFLETASRRPWRGSLLAKMGRRARDEVYP